MSVDLFEKFESLSVFIAFVRMAFLGSIHKISFLNNSSCPFFHVICFWELVFYIKENESIQIAWQNLHFLLFFNSGTHPMMSSTSSHSMLYSMFLLVRQTNSVSISLYLLCSNTWLLFTRLTVSRSELSLSLFLSFLHPLTPYLMISFTCVTKNDKLLIWF